MAKKISDYDPVPLNFDNQLMLLEDTNEHDFFKLPIDGVLSPAYGVEWDPTADTYTRIGRIASYAAGTAIARGAVVPNDLLPIQNGMYGCVVDDNGHEQYRLKSSNHNQKEDGSGSHILGTDGQVMIRVPEHWWLQEYVGGKHRFWVSPYPIQGYHHFTGGYMGKYQATLYDDGTSAYIDGDGNGGADTVNDILASVSSKKPWSGQTRAAFRTLAENRGTGWHQLDNRIYNAVLRLMVIEFATLNMQKAISEGNTKFAAWDFATCIRVTGKSNSYGEVSTGLSTPSGYNEDFVSYRGIEDIFGNLYQFLDGVNVKNVEADLTSYLWLCNEHANYADDTETNYTKCGELALLEGYGANFIQLINNLGGLYPSAVGGGSTAKLTDYFYTYYDNLTPGYVTDLRVVLVGGRAGHGAVAGVFFVSAACASSDAGSNFGARLCFSG